LSVLKSDHQSNGHLLHGAAVLSGRGAADGRVLTNGFSSAGGVLDGGGLTESSEGVLGGKLLKLDGSVLVEELINGEVASTDTDVNLVLVNSDGDSLGSELVDTIGLSHEHNLELLSVGEVVDVLGKSNINLISLNGDVDGDSGLEVDDVLLEGVDLELGRLEASEELNLGLADLEVLPFKLLDVAACLVELDLKGFLSLEHGVSVGKSSVQLGDEIVVVTKLDLEGGDLSLEHLDLNLKLTDEGV
jgi:hypothetical protein